LNFLRHSDNFLWIVGHVSTNRDPSMAEGEDQGNADRRPTPVRLAMEAGEPQGMSPAADYRSLLDPATGQEWIARVSGRSTGGVVPLRTIPLMEVIFSRAQEPDVPARRTLCRGELLGDLEDDELLQLLRTSLPHEPPPSGSPARGRRNRRGRPRRGT
jgi:hypothetical protein